MFENIKAVAYDKYQLDWMIEHGHSLKELMDSLTNYQYSDPEDSDTISTPINDLFYAWEKESGFSGEIWASFQEFLEYEWLYRNGEYMKNLLTKDEYEEYLKSIEKENDMENKNDYSQIDACAMSILNDSIDDYASRIYEKIKFFVREDVIQSSGISDKGDMENFSDGDVKLSIGRALCKNLNMEF